MAFELCCVCQQPKAFCFNFTFLFGCFAYIDISLCLYSPCALRVPLFVRFKYIFVVCASRINSCQAFKYNFYIIFKKKRNIIQLHK